MCVFQFFTLLWPISSLLLSVAPSDPLAKPQLFSSAGLAWAVPVLCQAQGWTRPCSAQGELQCLRSRQETPSPVELPSLTAPTAPSPFPPPLLSLQASDREDKELKLSGWEKSALLLISV